jgi:hypothetical protein
MLPGFRFLLAAIVICMSVLVFGLGAAALMRAAHEDFASNPTWRAPPEPRFAQQDETDKTVLAVLSVQPRATESAAPPKAGDAPAAEPTTASPETTAALSPSEASPDSAKPVADAPAQVDAPADASASASDTKVAATEPATAAPSEKTPPSGSDPASPMPQPSLTPEQLTTPVMPESSQAATRIATLGGPAVITEQTAAAKASASNAKLDRNELNKRLKAERAKERRRLVAHRARLAEQAAAAQLAANPFAPHPLIAPTPAPAH